MGFIKKLIFPLILMIAVVGGAIAADAMRGGGSGTTDGDHDKSASTSDDKSKKGKGDGKEGDDAKDSGGDVDYMKFKRQFVVPVMKQGKIDALVIMNLNLELNEKAPDNVYSLEPKLRDAITRELLSLSNSNIFGEGLTSAETYETLRNTLLTATKEVMPEGIRDVLILDVARQEQ